LRSEKRSSKSERFLLCQIALSVGEADILEIDGIEEVEQIKQFSKIIIEWCTSQQDPMNRIKSLQSIENQVRVRLDYIVSFVQTGVE
jgi:hypothetical protein